MAFKQDDALNHITSHYEVSCAISLSIFITWDLVDHYHGTDMHAVFNGTYSKSHHWLTRPIDYIYIVLDCGCIIKHRQGLTRSIHAATIITQADTCTINHRREK